MRLMLFWTSLLATFFITASYLSTLVNNVSTFQQPVGKTTDKILSFTANSGGIKRTICNTERTLQNTNSEQRNLTLGKTNSNLVESDEEFMCRMEKRMEERRAHVRKVCKERGYVDSIENVRDDTFYFDNFKVFFCHIPKTGSKNWNKLILKVDSLFEKKRNELFQEKEFSFKLMVRKYTNFDIHQVVQRQDTIKMLVVRDPMERILSAFRNRLGEEPRDYMKKLSRGLHRFYGKDNVTGYANFNEYVTHLVRSYALRRGDVHWKMYRQLCQPCAIDYDVIGKLETAKEDSRYFLRLIGAPDDVTLDNPEVNVTNNDVIKAYYDTVRPRANVIKLYRKLNQDYTLYNYSIPDFLYDFMDTNNIVKI